MRFKITVLFLSLILFSSLGIYLAHRHGSRPNHSSHATEQKKPQKYHCPMHPTYTADKPGDCPICGMKLVPVEEEDHERATQESSDDHTDHGKTDEAQEVQGYAPIKISAEREQLIGVKTGEIAYRNLKKVVRASARIAYDTDLYNAISEYKASLSSKEKVKESPWPDVHERADSLVRASYLRLRQLGISEDQIQNLNLGYQNPTNLLLGEKGGSVWVYAQIYEYETGLIQPGQMMEITAPALPGRKFQGAVKAVDPILNSETRSLKVRAEVPNPDGSLKPEMYVNAKILVDLGRKLAVPEEAVLNTGERQLVFIVSEGGRYAPRNVSLGQEAEGYYEILSGASEGEKVVTSANFLIDSESRLKAAVSGAGEHSH